MNISNYVEDLIGYAEERGLIEPCDRVYATNRVLEVLHVADYAPEEHMPVRALEDILGAICDYAVENGLCEDSVVSRDLFDTAVMGQLTPRPSEVIRKFDALYAISPEEATDYFYKLAGDSDYIRRDRVCRDLKWKTDSEYGEIDITVNLSKPEKDPKAIAAAKLLPQSGYPKCLLCHENEGYAGNAAKPARQTLRQIPMTMAGSQWYLQYSPYVYYNEHCIALSGVHTPMKIDRSTFVKLLDFVELFPHYFLGSNADLPIVGGSILSHDHMQGGHYSFAMEKAPVETPVTFRGYEDVEAGLVKWPMSVIRLTSPDKKQLVKLANKILMAWRGYSDESAFVFAVTDGEPHNTITPIARMVDGRFQLDLVLRNNITTEEHPLGVFHPHKELHNIKKENIGLIEVMGLAVLPARLKEEIELLCEALVAGDSIADIPAIAKHADWVAAFAPKYNFTAKNVRGILEDEIGKTFVKVLEDAGVYKRTESGKAAFLRFVDAVNAEK